MRTFALASVVLLGAGLAVPAHAAVDNPYGIGCQLSTLADPTAPPGTQAAQVGGGPLVLLDSTTGLPGSGTLECRVQVNGPTHADPGADSASVRGWGVGAVTAGPAVVHYQAGVLDELYLCEELTDDSDGTTYYYDGTHDVWSTDPAVDCTWTVDDPGGQDDPVDRVIREQVDPPVCAILAALAPGVPGVVDIAADGDLSVAGIWIWDCPPYGG